MITAPGKPTRVASNSNSSPERRNRQGEKSKQED
jgi:hypothetical protein